MKGFSGFKSPVKFKPGGKMEKQISNIERSSKHIAKRYPNLSTNNDRYRLSGKNKQDMIDYQKSKENKIRKKKVNKIKKGQELAKKLDMKIPIIEPSGDMKILKLGKQGKKRMFKKVIGKVASRAIPYAGWALAASDAFGIGKKMYRGASFKEAVKKQFL